MNPCSPSKGNKKRRNKSKTPPSVKKVIDDLFGADSSIFVNTLNRSKSFNGSLKLSQSKSSHDQSHSWAKQCDASCSRLNHTPNASNIELNKTQLSSSYIVSLNETPKQKTKKARQNYKFVRTFNSLNDVDAYVRTITKSGYKIGHNNGPVKCTICDHNGNKHQMEQQYWSCFCGVKVN